jgi:peptidoglycan/LPS O-acetylase OafA/YrhL
VKLQIGFFGEGSGSFNLRWEVFVGNMFFLQEILVPVYGLNGPLWSLSYEFWYYILFPCIVLLVCTTNKKRKTLYLLIVVFISMFVGPKIMQYFLVWLLGALVPFVKPFKFTNKFLNIFILLFSISLALLSLKTYILFDSKPHLQVIPDLSIGIAFAFLVYVIISLYNKERSKAKINISKHLAGFSYTLYLVHYPVANFVFTWMASSFWPISYTSIYIKIMIASFVLTYAWCTASFTEKHTDKVRKVFQKIIYEIRIKKTKDEYYSKHF